MNIIKTLSPHVADLIAAGEVVERPASVVKELLENSFDADATQITIEIQRGGMSLIRVTDNGCGMSPEDAGTCFLRHATSKLRDAEGLECIGTLGFRGEALAAIASVSRIQLLTRERGAGEGITIFMESGKEVSRSPAGCPEGCTILVRDLFYNTPARLKFMKKDSYEGSAVTAAVIRCALSHPSVSVRYLRDGKEEFKTAGTGKLDACIYTLLGREFAKNMLHAVGSSEDISVDGYVTSPFAAHGNRNMQYFFVNGRHVKSPLLQTALEQAYHNRLFTGRFPGCVLFLTVRKNAVDVNVHPAKTEVRFLQERKVFDAVYRAVESALDSDTSMPELPTPAASAVSSSGSETAAVKTASVAAEDSERPPLRPVFLPSSSRSSVPESRIPATSSEPDFVKSFGRSDDLSANRMKEIVNQLVFHQPSEPIKPDPPAEHEIHFTEIRGGKKLPVHSIPLPSVPTSVPEISDAGKAQAIRNPESAPVIDKPSELPAYRIIGEIFREYILVETEQTLLLVDKHAVHERLNFDRLTSERTAPMVQQLLEPQIVDLNPQDREMLLSKTELLKELGLEIEANDINSVSVHTLPFGYSPDDLHSFLCQISESLFLGADPGTLGQRDEVLATMACKAAIKAGMNNDPKELVPLVEAVLSQKVKYCPHGRPVSTRLTKAQLDKSFKRT